VNQDEIRAKAQALVAQKVKEVEESRKHLVKTMIDAGYNPEDYVIMDNWEEFKMGKVDTYSCWASKKLPNEVYV
jgi:ElaB/YqjD/DUF883 family membrane-anchored ribosome-binding protein